MISIPAKPRAKLDERLRSHANCSTGPPPDSGLLLGASWVHRIARQVLTEFVGAFQFLGRTPGAGHKREDLAEARPILFWPMRDYLILYKPGTDPLQVVTIVRGSRDIPRIVGRRGL